MSAPLILVANPGSSSRKYALFEGTTERARLHFEWVDGTLHCTLTAKTEESIAVGITSLHDATTAVYPILRAYGLLGVHEHIGLVGLRIVAPGDYFLNDHIVDGTFLRRFRQAKIHAPLHVGDALTELSQLREVFARLPVCAISDSAFHRTKPAYASTYGLPRHVADAHGIKRFGYHGLSVASVTRQMTLPEKTIVCHLGSGASITAVLNGQSQDTTMGFSPLEGLVMATRSGSIDVGAALALKKALRYDDLALETYLNEKSGLLGLGGSDDIRVLLRREKEGDTPAHLALETYVYNIQKGIGQMAAAIDGADALVFTGTVGERSPFIRQRVGERLAYLGFRIDAHSNATVTSARAPRALHAPTASKPLFVTPAQEEQEIARRALMLATA
jgi:acetate kinase